MQRMRFATKPDRCPGDQHPLTYLTDHLAVCSGGHEQITWSVLREGGLYRLVADWSRTARQLADLVLAQRRQLEIADRFGQPFVSAPDDQDTGPMGAGQ